MELTLQERESIESGDVISYVIPESHIECVVVRKDLLDPLRVRSDYSPCDPDDLAALTSEILDDEDWTMPEGFASEQRS